MTSSSTTRDRAPTAQALPATIGGPGRGGRSRPLRSGLTSVVVLGAVAVVGIVVAATLSIAAWRTMTPPAETACPLDGASESCWRDRTGVPGWSGDDIVAGRSPLVASVGDVEIDVDGTVLRDRWIEGCIAVKASDVTIENVLVRSDHGCVGGRTPAAPALISTGENGGGGVTGLVVRDTEIDGRGAPGDTMAIGQTEYTCVRCNIHGTAKGAKADQNVTVVDSYLHDLAYDGETHTEAFFFDGGAGGIRVQRNWMRANADHSTAAVSLINDWPGRDVVVRDNYLDGNGAVALVGGAVADKSAPAMTGVVVEGNVLVGLDTPGDIQHAHSYDPDAPGNRWSDNRDAVTGALVADEVGADLATAEG